MKNILILTSTYPANDLPSDNSPVVHYFAKEWIIQGYNVIVFHNIVYYPRIVHFILKLFEHSISTYYDYKFPTKQISKEKDYLIDKVKVYRLPMFKIFPLSLFSQKEQNKQLHKIKQTLHSINFYPDVIIGHWANPQLYQVHKLGKVYDSRTCMVIHNDVGIINKIYKNKATNIIKSIDTWGYRSLDIKSRFEKLYGNPNSSFLCYSGIPLNNTIMPTRTFNQGIKKFIFAGLLIPRKNPTILLKAINNAFNGKDFHITFIGEGPEKERIKRLAEKLNIVEKISLVGRVSRHEVLKMMNNSDCFIMLSKPETLGLVYLEAMSVGCITIGSKNEGIDGIIEHGINGFLCKPGDPHELELLLKNIASLSQERLISLSKHAMSTAFELTDQKAAAHYIEYVLK